MALVRSFSFERDTTVATFATGSVNGAGYSVATDVVRGNHTHSWKAAATSATWAYRLATATGPVMVIAVAFYGDALGGKDTSIVEVATNGGAARFMAWYDDTSATPRLFVSGVGNVASGPVISVGQWYVLVFQVELAVSATVRAAINGTEFGSYSGNTTGLGATFTEVGLGISNEAGTGDVQHFSDYAEFDDADDYDILAAAGTAYAVNGYRMTGDGALLQWTPNSGTVHFSRINEQPPDGDTSYLTDAGVGTLDSWTYPAAIANTQQILGTTYVAYAKRTAGATFWRPLYRIGGVNYPGVPQAPGAAYAYTTEMLLVSLASGEAWADAEINAMQVGADGFASNSDVRLSQVVWEVVECLGPGPISSASGLAVSSSTVVVGDSILVTLTARDINGNPVIQTGATVLFGTSGGESQGVFGPVTDHGDGTYTAYFRGSVAGSATQITATVNGFSVTTALPSVTVVAAPAAQGWRQGTMASRLQRSDFSRMWLLEGRAGPAVVPQYESYWKAGAPSWSLGDVTNVYVPDSAQYGQFNIAGKIIGERGNPTLPVTARYLHDAPSVLLKLAQAGCDSDLHIHIGLCKDPRDFNAGWDKILVLEAARPTTWGTTDQGAMMPSERAMVNEEVPFTGELLYEIMPIVFQEQAASQVVQAVVDVVICDTAQCGECGIPSDGCQHVFAVTLSNGGSPGLAAEVIFTDDGGTTWDDTNITTLSPTEDPNALACVAPNLVVVSEDSESLHYAPIADILAGSETWAEVTTGFVATKGPLAIFSTDPAHTWIVGEGGYVYFTEDPTAGVVVQDPGVVTTQDLNAIHGTDALHLVAVGGSNAVIITDNGGETWASLIGPAVGVALNTVWMRSEREWFIGTAGGELWYTLDSGDTWTLKAFPGSGAGVVRDIQFASATVGYMAHSTATPAGRILRTVNGGYSWYVAPENNNVIPANDYVKALAVCEEDVNVVYGGGLADNATDGFLVKGA